MNYLAHAYLSFNKADVLTGNMISDHIKGRAMYNFSGSILIGIKLHRQIDNFTDSHDSIKQIRSFFSPVYGLYSAVFADVVLDHFLANDKSLFTETSLKVFSHDCYKTIEQNRDVLPDGFTRIFPHMKTMDWLANYRNDQGIENAFKGLVHRAKYMNDSSAAFQIFLQNKNKMNEHYEDFFPQVKTFALQSLEELMNSD